MHVMRKSSTQIRSITVIGIAILSALDYVVLREFGRVQRSPKQRESEPPTVLGIPVFGGIAYRENGLKIRGCRLDSFTLS